MNPMRISLYCLAALATFMTANSLFAQANDFRMETEIFVEGAVQPTAKSLTLFSGSTVYDFLSGNDQQGEITVFDVRRGRFVVIDGQRKLKTTLTKEYLTKFLEQVKSQASEDVIARFVTLNLTSNLIHPPKQSRFRATILPIRPQGLQQNGSLQFNSIAILPTGLPGSIALESETCPRILALS